MRQVGWLNGSWVLAVAILGLPSLLIVAGIVVLLRAPRRPRWLAALGWLGIWVPAVVYQTLWWLSGSSHYSVDPRGALAGTAIGLWVLLGGRSVVFLFEGTAKDITGHRQFTMLDNWHLFLAMTAMQTGLLILLLLRFRQTSWFRVVAFSIGLAVLLNGVLGAKWPWWGT